MTRRRKQIVMALPLLFAGVAGVKGTTKGTPSVEKADGASLLKQVVNGKVRFFGENLKATSDFAKKAAHVANENISPANT